VTAASGPLASIVLPVHNQADHIGTIVERHAEVLAEVWPHHELVLVTNGCRDESVAVCEDLAARHQAVRTFDVTPGGWGRAVRAGLADAAGDVLCYTNSARTTTEQLALMLSYSRAYPEVVLKANRRLRDNMRRRMGSLLYNLEARALFDLPVWDVNGTPKIFPRSFDRLLRLEREDDLIDLEFVITCRREGYPLAEVPVMETTRHGGSSTTSLHSAWRMYSGAVGLKRALEQR
jgi:glycosyltransferase involved in cell wall biosynthesis